MVFIRGFQSEQFVMVGCALFFVVLDILFRVAKVKVSIKCSVSVPWHDLYWKWQRKEVILSPVICNAVEFHHSHVQKQSNVLVKLPYVHI